MPRIRKNNTHDATPASAQKITSAPHNIKQPDSLPAADYAKKNNLTNILKVLEADEDLIKKIESEHNFYAAQMIVRLSEAVKSGQYSENNKKKLKLHIDSYQRDIRHFVEKNAETIKSKLGEAFQDQTSENLTETITTTILKDGLAKFESEINSLEKHYKEFIPQGRDTKQLLEKMIKETLEPLHSLAYNKNNDAAIKAHLKTLYEKKQAEKKQAEIQKNIEENLKIQGQMNNDKKKSMDIHNQFATQTVEKNQDAAQYKKFESLIDTLYQRIIEKSTSKDSLNTALKLLKETYDLKGKKLVLRVFTNPQSTRAEIDRFSKDLQILVKYSEEKENEKLDKQQADIDLDEHKRKFKEEIAKLEAEASDYAKKHKLINILEVFKVVPDLEAKIEKKHGEYEEKIIKAIKNRIEANINKTTPDTKDIEDFANATNKYAEDIRTLVKPEADKIKLNLGEAFKNQTPENVTETITTAILQNSLAKSQSDASLLNNTTLIMRYTVPEGTNTKQVLEAKIKKIETKIETIIVETLKPLISLAYNKNNYAAAQEFYNKQVIIKKIAEDLKNIEKFRKEFEIDNAKLYKDAKATEPPLTSRQKIIELEQKKFHYAWDNMHAENSKLNDAKIEKYKGIMEKVQELPEYESPNYSNLVSEFHNYSNLVFEFYGY